MTELYAYERHLEYEIFVNCPYEEGGDDNFEGFIYFNKTALEGYCTDKTGEGCLIMCKQWIDKFSQSEPVLFDEDVSRYETSNINLCTNKGCGLNTDNVCSAEGTICYGDMEVVDETTY